MASTKNVTAGIERRMVSRRTESERRDAGRKDPSPRRSQLRRKTDVVDFLGSPRGQGATPELGARGRLPKRPLKSWIERGLGKDKGRLFS
jgi:hypothetical protein